MSIENEELTAEQIDEHLKEVLGEEAFGQLDELSKKTLGSYIVKSAAQHATAQSARDRHYDHADTVNRSSHNAPPEAKKAIDAAGAAHREAGYKADYKRMKRGSGIVTAVKKLTKESIEEMIGAAHENKPVEFAAAFASAMQGVIADKIDELRPEVAAGLFNGAKE